jgi:outer membrane cobalamin receptor
LIFLISVCAISVLRGQSTIKIEGRVYNKSGKPLEGAEVIVEGTAYGAASDASGYYYIENLFTGSYTLIATYSGFAPERVQHIRVQNSVATTVNFHLHEKPFQGTKIVIEADRIPDDRFRNQYFFDNEDIKLSGARTLDELLNFAPGIMLQSSSADPASKLISIRGSESNQVLVLLDGIALNDPLTGTIDLRLIPLNSIKEIRIISGGQSSTYGNGALGGVIDIISEDEFIESFGLNLHAGSFGSRGFRPSFSGHLKNLTYSLYVDYSEYTGDYAYSYTQLDQTKLNADRINNGFLGKNIYAQSKYRNDEHELSVKLHWQNSKRGLPGLIYALTPYSNARTERVIVNPSYTYKYLDWKIGLVGIYQENFTDFKNIVPRDAPLAYRTVPSYHSNYRVISNRLQISLSETDRFKASAEYNVDRLRDRDKLIASQRSVSHAVFRQYSAALKKTWQLLPGAAEINTAIRYDRTQSEHDGFSRATDHISPRIGIYAVYSLASIFGSWGKSFRSPTLADLFYQDFRVRGNPDLLPEKSIDSEVGLTLGFPLLNGRTELYSTYFQQNISNLIHWELGSFATWQPYNTDARISGLELGLSWEIPEKLGIIQVNHMVLDPRNRSTKPNTNNRILTYRPRTTTQYGLQMSYAGVTIHYIHNVTGRRYVTAANTIALPAYSVDDIVLSYTIDIESYQILISVAAYNLFDTRFELVERGPVPGRHWRINLEFSK